MISIVYSVYAHSVISPYLTLLDIVALLPMITIQYHAYEIYLISCMLYV